MRGRGLQCAHRPVPHKNAAVLAFINDKPAVALRAIIDCRCAAGSPFAPPRPCAFGAAGLGDMVRALWRALIIFYAEACRLGELGPSKECSSPRWAIAHAIACALAAVPFWALLTAASLSSTGSLEQPACARAMSRTMERRKVPPP